MNGGFIPATNLHSPGPIGDVTPGTIAVTSSTLGGNVVFSSDATYDIGASASSRPASVYVGVMLKSFNMELTGNYLGISSNTQIQSGGQGVLLLMDFNTATTFNRIQLGGTTSSFPAIKRSSTVIQARLADDSAFAPLQGKLTTDTNATTGLTAGVLSALTNASLEGYDASGQKYRIPVII